MSALTGTAYLTARQFQDHLVGLDLTGIPDDDLLNYIRQASRDADSYIHGTFDVVARSERQIWSNVRRFYPQVLPVHAVRDVILHIGGGLTATIGPTDLFINNEGGYVEVVSLATSVGLSAELVSLGLVQVVAELTYKTGGGMRDALNLGVSWTSTTTLAEDIGSTDTSFDVADASDLSVNDVIRVGTERMWVTDISSNTLTVVRAAQTDDSADAHSSSAAVELLTLDLNPDVEQAVAMITACRIAARRQAEEGTSGVRNFMIGGYSLTYNAAQQEAGGGGYPFVPKAAQDILEAYRRIALR